MFDQDACMISTPCNWIGYNLSRLHAAPHTPDYSVCIQNQTKFYRKIKLQKKINRIRARVMNEFWRTIQLHVAYARRLAMPSQASEYIHVLLLFSPSHMLVQLWDRLRYVELNESAKDDIIWK